MAGPESNFDREGVGAHIAVQSQPRPPICLEDRVARLVVDDFEVLLDVDHEHGLGTTYVATIEPLHPEPCRHRDQTKLRVRANAKLRRRERAFELYRQLARVDGLLLR